MFIIIISLHFHCTELQVPLMLAIGELTFASEHKNVYKICFCEN